MIEFIIALGSKAFWILVVIGMFLALGLLDKGPDKPLKKKEEDADTKWKKWREKRDEKRKSK